MADKDKKNPLQLPDEEQEYRPPEEEEAGEQEEKPRGSVIKVLLANRRVWLVIAIVVAVTVVYQFVKVPKVKEEIQTVRSLQQKAVMPSEPQTEAQNTTVQGGGGAAAPLVSGETQQQADALLSQNRQSQAQIQQLQLALQQIQVSMQQLNNQAATRCNVASGLAQIQPLPAVAPVKPRVKRIVRKAAPRVIYHVRAIVPGRAWLYATRDRLGATVVLKSLTVKVGDRLPGYGRVERISPEQGKVWTRSGRSVTYGSNDI